MTPYRHIGQPTPRKDAAQIVTGTAMFLDDLTLPHLAYGRVLRSPHAHAQIRSIDVSRAAALPGVLAVLTWEDMPDWRGGNPRSVRPLDRRVRFVGDSVALVAAESEAAAEAALGLIDVEYEVLPAVFDPVAALALGAPQLWDDAPGNVVRPGISWFGPNCLTGLAMGDVDQGFAEADVVVEGEVAYQGLPNPLPPESPGAIALFEEPDKVTLWLSSQAPYQDKVVLHFAFGRTLDVRTIGGACGGSYGSKFMTVQVSMQATALSRAIRRPVKLQLTKEEHLAVFTTRIGSRLRAKVGLRRDGTVTAVSGDWLVDTGCYSMTTQAQIAVGCGEAQLAVRCPNWDLRPTIACTNRAASGIVRGFGGQELKCSLLPIFGLALARLDLDPFPFFRRNYVRPGDGYYWRDGEWYVYRGIDFTAAMDAGAEAFGWRDLWKGWLRPTSVDGSRRTGVGVAVHGNVDIGEDVSEAYVRLDPEGCATLYSPASEHGTGQPSNLIKMVAEVLQLPLERVSLMPADTQVSPYDFGPVGSRGTWAMGGACIAAAEDALAQLLTRAAERLEVPPETLETYDGRVFPRDEPGRSISWAAALGIGHTILGQGGFEPDFTLANCMMTFVEVAVDTETGRVDLLRVVNATDAGTIIDPPGLMNQLDGCLGSAGIDSALFEETVLDARTGHVLSANMADYKWRTFAQLPEVRNVVLESGVDSHRFGAIGVGEVATAPGPAAVMMAVSNALGVWLHEYPVTPARVLAALRDAAAAPGAAVADAFMTESDDNGAELPAGGSA